LIDVGGDSFLSSAFYLCRRGKIGETLRKIDGLILNGHARHFADYGFGETSGFRGE